MRPLLIALAMTIASSAYAQQGGVWYGGPYAPSRVAPAYNYYNASAPVYPVAGNPFGRSYGYGWQQPAYRREVRELRWAIEDASIIRPYGRW